MFDQVNKHFLNDVIRTELERQRPLQALVANDGAGNVPLDLFKPSKPGARVLDGR